jgi:hypothetical protein
VSSFKKAIVFVALLLAATICQAGTTLYLQGGGVPAATLSTSAPTAALLANHDPGRDSVPGLLIERGGSGPSETDPFKHQQWTIAAAGTSLDGPVALEFWAAMANFAQGSRGVVEAFLLDCDASGTACSTLAQGSREVVDWSGGFASFGLHSIEFGAISHQVASDRSLAVKLVVGTAADDDMLFAYDTSAYASRLTDTAVSDIVVDGDFSDWFNGHGINVGFDDQAGAEDWKSPSRLDVTHFAVSTNRIDAFQMLMGVDDAPANGATAATLLDTDIDDNANFALVAEVNGSQATVELYRCDDTLSDGCDNDVLLDTYTASYYAVGTAPGPWNIDSYVELTVPFSDVGFNGGGLMVTSMVSYAASSLLTSAKDSIFGTGGQDYTARLYFDTIDGVTTVTTGPVGAGFVVRRHADPSQVRSTASHATPSQGPFDDTTGTLDDGQVYFYVVENSGGVPAKLSAHANVLDRAVRLGFDDDDPLSALADPAVSTVIADAATIGTDGIDSVTVTVVPRDVGGTPLGRGLDLTVDSIQLAPAMLAGPVTDRLDGSYSFDVVSQSTGTAVVEITVEGTILSDLPQIELLAN